MTGGAFSKQIVFVLMLPLFVAGCGKGSSSNSVREELLIYCGTTMIQPMQEIAKVIEEERNCVIKLTKGGSGNLLKGIKANQAGDLYLPGGEAYMNICLADGYVHDAVCVGYNVAAIIVPEGNPKNISADLTRLTNSSCVVVLANPDSGSIGRQANAILEKYNLLKQVIENRPLLTTDSKDITRMVANGTADLGINWYATTLWPENTGRVDALMIDEQYAPRERLMLGLLSFSRFPEAARRVMEYAVSKEGREIFKKYGFYPQKGREDVE